ncbi:MAG TPA: hypothetical protein VNH64_10635, partial [Parvularculaceae bacterium]|nr:hypothetical protein [Parvularculaceae bacterium]
MRFMSVLVWGLSKRDAPINQPAAWQGNTQQELDCLFRYISVQSISEWGFGAIMKWRSIAAIAAALFLCSCGGSNSTSPPMQPPPLATIHATLTPAQISLDAVDGEYAPLRVEATLDAMAPAGAIPKFIFDSNIFEKVSETQNGDTFALDLRLKTDARLAQTQGSIQFRLCATSACQQTFPGSSVSTPFSVKVDIAETTAPGRNERGANYVGLQINDPQTFQKLWELPISSYSFKGFSTYHGLTFVSGSDATEHWIVAIDIATGVQRWRQTVPR